MTQRNEQSEELIDLGDVAIETKGAAGIAVDSASSLQQPFGMTDD